MLLLAVELNSRDPLQDAVVCQVNIPLLEGSRDGWASRHQHGTPMTHALDTEGLPTPTPDAGIAQEPRRGCGKGWNSAGSEGGERPGRQGGRKAGRRGGLRGSRPHLQLRLQARSVTQERSHHVVCDGELVWNLRAAADQAWVDTIEVLVPKEAVLCPVLSHVLW